MSTADFTKIVSDWLASATDPASSALCTELVYQPMLELPPTLAPTAGPLIVSGCGIEFHRKRAAATTLSRQAMPRPKIIPLSGFHAGLLTRRAVAFAPTGAKQTENNARTCTPLWAATARPRRKAAPARAPEPPVSAASTRTQLRVPLWKQARSYFSFGEWIASSSSPKPIKSESMPSTSRKSPRSAATRRSRRRPPGFGHSSLSACRASPNSGASTGTVTAREPSGPRS